MSNDGWKKDLLPCPTCGNKNLTVKWRRDGSYVICVECWNIGPMVIVYGMPDDFQDDLAILAWNKKAEDEISSE